MLKTTSHIIISVLILFLTIGISINKHYSNGKLFSWSVLGEAETCDAGINEVCTMQNMHANCDMHKKTNTKNKQDNSCSCEDTSEYIHFDAVYAFNKKMTIDKIYQNTIILFLNPVTENYSSILFSNKQFRIINSGTPPDKTSDYTSLFQIFLC